MRTITIISIVFMLAACGSGHSSQSTSGGTTTAATPTPTPSATPVAPTGPTVAEILTALADIQLCKKVAEQPADVQVLLNTTTTASNTGTTTHRTYYSNKEWNVDYGASMPAESDFYRRSDSTDKIAWYVIASSEQLYYVDYQMNDKPEVYKSQTCN